MSIKKISRVLTVTMSAFSAALLLTSCSAADQAVKTENVNTPSQSDNHSEPDSHSEPDTHKCATAQLSFEVTRDQGAAGKILYFLTAKNTGDSTCTLAGYPGVSFVDESGNHIGLSAERTGKDYEVIELASGKEAQAILAVGNVDNYAGCEAQLATNAKIVPPEETHATVVPVDFQVCSSQIANVAIDPFSVQ